MNIFKFLKHALVGQFQIGIGGGGSSGGSSSTTTELPEYAQPAAQDIITRGTELSNNPIPKYTGQTYAGMNDQQSQAIQGMAHLANGGSNTAQVQGGVVNTANNGGNNYQTIGAATAQAAQNPYADMTNPYLQQMVNTANTQTTNAFNQNAMGLNAQFQNSGAFGGSAYQNMASIQNQNLGAALANNSSQIYNNAYNQAVSAAGQNASLQTQTNLANANNQLAADQLNSGNYNTAQARALTAAGLGTTLDGSQSALLNQSYTGGTAAQTDAQNQLNSQYQQWYQGAMSPYEQLGVLESALSGALGNGAQGISETSQSANPLGAIAGLGVSGMGLLGSLASSGYL